MLVLIVDDDNDVRELLASMVALNGYQAETASGAEAALERVGQSPMPDVIITDIMMPGQTGYTLLKKLQSGNASKIPIIIISGILMDASTEQMILDEANVIGFIPKPISPKLLDETLRKVL